MTAPRVNSRRHFAAAPLPSASASSTSSSTSSLPGLSTRITTPSSAPVATTSLSLPRHQFAQQPLLAHRGRKRSVSTVTSQRLPSTSLPPHLSGATIAASVARNGDDSQRLHRAPLCVSLLENGVLQASNTQQHIHRQPHPATASASASASSFTTFSPSASNLASAAAVSGNGDDSQRLHRAPLRFSLLENGMLQASNTLHAQRQHPPSSTTTAAATPAVSCNGDDFQHLHRAPFRVSLLENEMLQASNNQRRVRARSTPRPTDTTLLATASALYRRSLTDDTIRNYTSNLRRFLADGFTLPCDSTTVAAAVALHHSLGHATGTLSGLCAALSRYHLDRGLPDPCAGHAIAQLRQGFSKAFAQQRRLATSATDDTSASARNYVAALDSRAISPVLQLASHTSRLRALDATTARNLACVVVGFLFMLRPSSIICMRVSDFAFFANDMLRFTVAWEKTRIGMDCRVVNIPLSHPQQPWVRLLEVALAHARDAGDSFLLPASASSPEDAVWPTSALDVSASLREAFHKRRAAIKKTLTVTVRSLVEDVRSAHPDLPPTAQFTGRSLRAGGATAAAAIGLPLKEVERVGNWRAQTTLDRYVRQALAIPDTFVSTALESVLLRQRSRSATTTRTTPTAAPRRRRHSTAAVPPSP